MSKTQERSTLGTWVSSHDKPMKAITVRVKAETHEKLKTLNNRQEFMRQAIEKALAENE
jgi:hypothetical protein